MPPFFMNHRSGFPKAGMPRFRSARRIRGFSLVISLSLMVLLSLLAVGMLSLAGVTLRQSQTGEALAQARANARLAMILALGDLQKTLGPDQAVSAPSDLPAPSTTSSLTGAWRSWAPKPDDAAPDYRAEKNRRFLRWLVSDPRPDEVRKPTYANGTPADPAVLASGGPSGEGRIVAGRVRVGDRGGFAWHVSDEAVKARIDLARDPSPGTSLAEQRALVAGHRPGIRNLDSAGDFKFTTLPGDATPAAFAESRKLLPKLTSLNQAEIPGGDITPALGGGITTLSLGVLCDVRDGGLKRDLSSAFAMSGGLPQELANQRLYQSTHGVGGASDPYWSMLSEYHNFHRKLNRSGPPTYTMERPDAVRVDRQLVPRKYQPGPVIQKFDMMFSAVAREAHGPHPANLARIDPDLKYIVHLVLLPLFTLHNPYNVELVFDRLNIIVADMPVGLNFYINGQPQNSRFVPINDFWIGTGANDGRIPMAMRYDLANWQSPGESTPGAPIRMKPGQTLVFGPYLDPNATSANTMRGFWGTREELVNAPNKALKLRPGFTGKAVGVSFDFLCPHAFRLPTAQAHRAAAPSSGLCAVRWSDRFHCEAAFRRPEIGVTTEWDLSARIVVGGRETEYGGMRFVYEDDATLYRHHNSVWRYPASGSLAVEELYEPYGKPLREQSRAKVFAMFSTAARTAAGGIYEHGGRDRLAGALNAQRDGRLAGKPFLHHNAARPAMVVNLKTEAIGQLSHEMNLQPLRGETDDVLEIDANNRGPAITGNTTFRGIKSAALFDVPSGPMQSIAAFRRSNAFLSTYLPNPVQPVGNSWVPPALDTTTTRQNGVTSYALLDHSYLANHALYDGFYFSTITARNGETAQRGFDAFVNEGRPLLNQAYQPWRPADGDPATLFTGNAPAANTWREAAAWQLVKGPFNINSTSVLAWKAMLSSLADTPIPTLWAKSFELENIPSPSVPVPSMTLPLAGPAEAVAPDPAKIDNRRANEWNGFRSLDPTELEVLANRIVEEVRLRGPFLSMSEFVNRRIGANSELTRTGALQAAIDQSGVNDRLFRDLPAVRAVDVADRDLYGFRTPEVSVGHPADGAPGTITQGDLLHVLEPRATVRGDTFIIRTSGQAFDGAGKVLATAHLEAVVQRVPDFIDPADAPSAPIAQLNPVNTRFGRRFDIVSLRWLSPREI